MSQLTPEHTPIVFAPSLVRGVSNVTEVEVRPEQIRFHTTDGASTLSWKSVASFDSPPFRWLHKRPMIGIIGELHFDRTNYAQSYIRLFTIPEITIFMPTEGPAKYPDSEFWKFQEVVRVGGFRLIDTSQGERKQDLVDFAPAWAKTLRNASLITAIANFVLFLVMWFVIGGGADPNVGSDGRFFVRSRGSQTEVSHSVWLYSIWHRRAMLTTHALAFVACGIWYVSRRPAKRLSGGCESAPDAEPIEK